MAPLFAKGDDKWFNIVRWTLFALLEAEELGITQKTVAADLDSRKPDIRRFLGSEGDNGQQLGLEPKWAYNIVASVGNYGEMFERTIGEGSLLKINRGINALWNKGGLMYAPPVK